MKFDFFKKKNQRERTEEEQGQQPDAKPEQEKTATRETAVRLIDAQRYFAVLQWAAKATMGSCALNCPRSAAVVHDMAGELMENDRNGREIVLRVWPKDDVFYYEVGYKTRRRTSTGDTEETVWQWECNAPLCEVQDYLHTLDAALQAAIASADQNDVERMSALVDMANLVGAVADNDKNPREITIRTVPQEGKLYYQTAWQGSSCNL